VYKEKQNIEKINDLQKEKNGMGITDVLALLGGLALFLYGMQMMSTGLEAAAGKPDEVDP